MEKTFRGIAALCVAIALAAGAASAVGVFARGDGSTAAGTSIRGERFEYATTGIYANNPVRVVAEGVGWDAVTLVFAIPVLLLATPALARGSLRARLLTLGVLAYLFYQYFMYAMFWALGPLFPVFIVLFVASAVAMVWIVSTVDLATLPARFDERFPRRGMIGFCIFAAVLLTGMWSVRIATGLSGDLEGASLLGMTTLTVQALDLGIVVPLAVATAVLLWRRRPWGYLLASVFAVKGLTMAGAICAMLVSAALVEGSLEVVPFVVFGGLTVAAAVFARKIFGSVHEEASVAVPASHAAAAHG